MCNEVAGMYAGIGPSGAGYGNRFTDNHRQGFFNTFLNRESVGLNLPSMKTGAFVSEFYEIPLSQWVDFLQK